MAFCYRKYFNLQLLLSTLRGPSANPSLIPTDRKWLKYCAILEFLTIIRNGVKQTNKQTNKKSGFCELLFGFAFQRLIKKQASYSDIQGAKCFSTTPNCTCMHAARSWLVDHKEDVKGESIAWSDVAWKLRRKVNVVQPCGTSASSHDVIFFALSIVSVWIFAVHMVYQLAVPVSPAMTWYFVTECIAMFMLSINIELNVPAIYGHSVNWNGICSPWYLLLASTLDFATFQSPPIHFLWQIACSYEPILRLLNHWPCRKLKVLCPIVVLRVISSRG